MLKSDTSKEIKYLETIPEEVIVYIFSFLNIKELSTMAFVSRNMKRISETNNLWCKLFYSESKREKVIVDNNINYKNLIASGIKPLNSKPYKKFEDSASMPYSMFLDKHVGFCFGKVSNKYSIIVTLAINKKNKETHSVYVEYGIDNNYYLVHLQLSKEDPNPGLEITFLEEDELAKHNAVVNKDENYYRSLMIEKKSNLYRLIEGEVYDPKIDMKNLVDWLISNIECESMKLCLKQIYESLQEDQNNEGRTINKRRCIVS